MKALPIKMPSELLDAYRLRCAPGQMAKKARELFAAHVDATEPWEPPTPVEPPGQVPSLAGRIIDALEEHGEQTAAELETRIGVAQKTIRTTADRAGISKRDREDGRQVFFIA